MNKVLIPFLLLVLFAATSSHAFFFFMVLPGKNPAVGRLYLKSGKVIRDTLKCHIQEIDGQEKQYFEINNTKIFPDETDSILVNGYTGIPFLNTWLFKLVDGQISLYTNDPFVCKITHMQLNHGQIIQYSLDTLKVFLKGRQKALSLLHGIMVNRTQDGPNPCRAAIEFNDHIYGNKDKVDSLWGLLRRGQSKGNLDSATILNQICNLDSTDCEAYWDLGEHFYSIDTEKAIMNFALFIKHNFSAYRCNKARHKIAELKGHSPY
jgi:hypothetical protein